MMFLFTQACESRIAEGESSHFVRVLVTAPHVIAQGDCHGQKPVYTDQQKEEHLEESVHKATIVWNTTKLARSETFLSYPGTQNLADIKRSAKVINGKQMRRLCIG